MILWLIGLYETTDGPELFVGHCDQYFMVQVILLNVFNTIRHIYIKLQLTGHYDTTNDLIL